MPEFMDTNKTDQVKNYQMAFEKTWLGLLRAIKDVISYIASTDAKTTDTETYSPWPPKKRKILPQSAIENLIASAKTEINNPRVGIHNPYETRGEAEDKLFSHPEIPMSDNAMQKLSRRFFAHELSFPAEPELLIVKEMRQWRLNTGQSTGISCFPLTFYSFLSNIL